MLTRRPLALLCGQQLSELVTLQHVYNGLMRTPLAEGTRTKGMENTSCTTVQLVNSHFPCKAVQSISSSVTGCPQGHVDTLEHQGRSEKEEGQHPTMCLDRMGSALEILQCCSSFVLLQNRAAELGASPLLAQPHGCGTSCPAPQPAPSHAVELPPSQPVPSPGSCSQGGERL